jgi:predicted acetyltransferase
MGGEVSVQMDLVSPTMEHLQSYREGLMRGWLPSSEDPHSGERALRRIDADASAFIASLDDRDGAGGRVELPDGSTVPRLPGIEPWIWDGAFAGRIALRWQPGTVDLPPTCLGHIGYGVVAWRRNLGYATAALRQVLPHARAVGLPWVELTTDVDNVASQKVVTANGGILVEEFLKPESHGGGAALRWRISPT